MRSHQVPSHTTASTPRRTRRTRSRLTGLGMAAGTVIAAAGLTSTALFAGAAPAGAATSSSWAMTAGNVQRMSGLSSATTAHFFDTPASYGNGASLVKSPVQARYATTPVLTYTSYAHFSTDIHNGNITYPYKWVMYDPETWSATPVSEQRNPIKYITQFGQLAHAHGLKVIQAPALDLAWAPGSVLPIRRGESGNQWFARVNIAAAAAAAGDIFDLQNESNIKSGGQYARMFNTTASQARAANPKVKVFSEVATDYGTAAQMASAAESISPDGYYVAAAGDMPTTLQFFQIMKAAGY